MIFLIVFIICAFVILILHNKKKESSIHPAHFDLLDENGDPITTVHSNSVAVEQQLKYFSIKDKGYHVGVWPKEQGIQGLDYIEFSIAGITHGENVEEHFGESVATLEPEPTNEYDPNAIKILAQNGDRIGYVPKDMTDEVRKFTILPCTCYCYIGQHDGTYFTDCYISHDNP